MAGTIEARLKAKGIEVPAAVAPAFNYVPTVLSGQMLYVAGQVPFKGGELTFKGRLGDTMSLEDGQAAARLCALNILGQAKAALGGDLDRVRRVVKLVGFVHATADFGDHPKVVNAASDVMVEAFGDAGRHARSAVGVSSLPFGVAVEVEAILEVG
jgi:enamine deaminase RidA (YjgF/YER057c/UK114 family)